MPLSERYTKHFAEYTEQRDFPPFKLISDSSQAYSECILLIKGEASTSILCTLSEWKMILEI